MNGNGQYKFRKFIREKIKLSPEKFTDTLISKLKEYSGRDDFDDDLCIMVLDIL